MREFKYTPSICLSEMENENGEIVKKMPTHDGYIMIGIPDIEKRMEYLEQIGFEFSAKGELAPVGSNMNVVKKMIGIARNHINQVNLKCLANGETTTDKEDLFYDPEFQGTLIEVATKVLHGVKVSKN